jgi:Flp pilus assembly pilin Flp
MKRVVKAVRSFFRDEGGQGTVEWVLITALIVVAIMALIYAFRGPIFKLIEEAQATVEGWSAD